MKVITSDLTDRALDWAVAKCSGVTLVLAPYTGARNYVILGQNGKPTSSEYLPSTSWAQGGPIIEREGISVTQFGGAWKASTLRQPAVLGPTHLVAAMRAYVASKLGDEVEIPEGLTC